MALSKARAKFINHRPNGQFTSKAERSALEKRARNIDFRSKSGKQKADRIKTKFFPAKKTGSKPKGKPTGRMPKGTKRSAKKLLAQPENVLIQNLDLNAEKYLTEDKNFKMYFVTQGKKIMLRGLAGLFHLMKLLSIIWANFDSETMPVPTIEQTTLRTATGKNKGQAVGIIYNFDNNNFTDEMKTAFNNEA